MLQESYQWDISCHFFFFPSSEVFFFFLIQPHDTPVSLGTAVTFADWLVRVRGAVKPAPIRYLKLSRDFPGGPVAKTLGFHCRGPGLIPGQETQILHAAWHSRKKKKKKISVIHQDGKLLYEVFYLPPLTKITILKDKKAYCQTCLVVKQLILQAYNAGGQGLIPGQGIRAHISKLKIQVPQLRFSAAK